MNSRMSTCNAHNQELKRKVSQLEKRNMWEISKWDLALHLQTILPLRSPPLCVVVTFLPIYNLPVSPSSRLQPFVDLYTLSDSGHICCFLPFFPLDRRSLMGQLRRLQALIMNTSNRPAQTGTCVLVCLSSLFARKKTNHSPATPDK